MAERYRSMFQRFVLPDGTEGVHREDRPGPPWLDPGAISMLRGCQTLRTLESHQAILQGQGGAEPGPTEGIRATLARLVESGLLVSEEALLQSLAGLPADDRALDGITTFGCVTADRPEALRRCLRSFSASPSARRRDLDVVVVDDSREAGNRGASREALAALRPAGSGPLLYAGMEEKRLFAERLVQEGIPPEVSSFCFFGDRDAGLVTPGANRNVLLLHALDGRLFSLDDDTVCSAARFPGAREGVRIASYEPEVEGWFFPDRQAALHSADLIDADLVQAHERWLGRRVAACLTDASWAGGDLDDATPELLHDVVLGKARIEVTQSGFLGDCGLEAPHHLFAMPGPTFARLTADEATYRAACSSREQQRGVSQLKVTRPFDLWGGAFGVDLHGAAPPFPPLGRSEDTVFGSILLRSCGACAARLPLAVLHLPLEERRFPADALDAFGRGTSLARVMLLLLPDGSGRGASDGSQRLADLGRSLVEASSLPAADFEEQVCVGLLREGELALARLSARLQMGGPPYWLADMQRFMEVLRDSLERRESFVPVECRAAGGLEQGFRLTQQRVRGYAELLVWWPAILDATRRLAGRGVRPAQPV